MTASLCVVIYELTLRADVGDVRREQPYRPVLSKRVVE